MWAVVLCQIGTAAEESVFEQRCAEFDVKTKQIRGLKKGRKLFTDRDFTLKMRPKKLSATRYILNSFAGSSVVCSKGGVVFALALFDVHNQARTKAAENYLEKEKWQAVKDVPPFVLYYTNGADRTGRLFWKEVDRKQKLTIPSGIVLCYRYGKK